MHDQCMAVKTITIDLEAYDALARLKREGQSFSQVIKERLGPRRGRDLLGALDAVSLAEDTLDEVERQIERRRESPARIPDL